MFVTWLLKQPDLLSSVCNAPVTSTPCFPNFLSELSNVLCTLLTANQEQDWELNSTLKVFSKMFYLPQKILFVLRLYLFSILHKCMKTNSSLTMVLLHSNILYHCFFKQPQHNQFMDHIDLSKRHLNLLKGKISPQTLIIKFIIFYFLA